VALAGSLFCGFKRAQKKFRDIPFKNPASLSDSQFLKENSPRLSGGGISIPFRQRLLARTFTAPGFSAVQLALWHGDFSGLPFWLLQKYRERGLLQVLALSGQHVWALAFCLSFFGGFLWRFHPRPRGRLLLWSRKFKVPVSAGILLGLAPSEPSLIRTAVCVGLLFMIREIPLRVNQFYLMGSGGMFFLSIWPNFIFEKSFQLSALGITGVWTVKNCFNSKQKIAAGIWLALWFGALMAFFFGKWVGDSFWVQIGVGWLWDQVLLPFWFFGGILVLVVPQSWSVFVAQSCEKIVQLWFKWEAIHSHPSGMSIYRPSLWETGIFLGWLVALAYWNLKRCQVVTKKNAYGATCIDLTRSARRQ